jgi:hypothetical protein
MMSCDKCELEKKLATIEKEVEVLCEPGVSRMRALVAIGLIAQEFGKTVPDATVRKLMKARRTRYED